MAGQSLHARRGSEDAEVVTYGNAPLDGSLLVAALSDCSQPQLCSTPECWPLPAPMAARAMPRRCFRKLFPRPTLSCAGQAAGDTSAWH